MFPSPKILAKKNISLHDFYSISGPRQRRSLQKLEMVIATVLVQLGIVLCLAVLVSILLVVLDTVSLFY